MRKIVKILLVSVLTFVIIQCSTSALFAQVDIVGKFKYRYGNVACTYDETNNFFYVQHEEDNTITKLDGTDYTVIETFQIPFSLDETGYPWSMTHDGINLWIAYPWGSTSEGRLYAMDPATGDSVSYINTGVGDILRGVDWDGENFWIGTNLDGTGWIYKLDAAGVHLDSFEVSANVAWLNQLCVAEDEIWINDDRLYFTSYDKSGNFLQRVDSPIPGPWAYMSHDLTFDGNDIVTVCWNQDIIYKMYIGKGHGQYVLSVTGLEATSDASTPASITLAFTAPTQYINGNAASPVSYNVYNYDTDELVATGTSSPIEVTGLTNEEAYSFYVRAVDADGYEGLYSDKFGTRAGGLIAGDLIKKVPLFNDGWTSMAWDGDYAWIQNENLQIIAKVDVETGDTLKTIPFTQWTNGFFWDDSDNTIWVNSPGTGSGEIWQIDTLGNILSWFPTDMEIVDGTCTQRGIAWDGTNIWVGQTNYNTFYLFDRNGQDMGIVYCDVQIGWQRGMAWVDDKLWLVDGGSEQVDATLRIFEYNGSDSLKQVSSVNYWWEGWPLDLIYTGEKVIVAGWQSSDLFILSTGVVSGIDDGSGKNLTPDEYVLEQNYPNPFNPETTITYKLPKSENVKIEVFNLLGQKVTVLVNKKQEAGSHKIIWNGLTSSGKKAASGIYFYRFSAGNFTKVKKMALLK